MGIGDELAVDDHQPRQDVTVDFEDALAPTNTGIVGGAAFVLKFELLRKREREGVSAVGEIDSDVGRERGHAASVQVHGPSLLRVISPVLSPFGSAVMLSDMSMNAPA